MVNATSATTPTATTKYTNTPIIIATLTATAIPSIKPTISATPSYIIEKIKLNDLALNENNANKIKKLAVFDTPSKYCRVSSLNAALGTRFINGQTEYLLASIGHDNQNIQIWNLGTEKIVQTLNKVNADSLLFHPDQKTIISLSLQPGALTLWDIESGDQKYKFSLHSDHFNDEHLSISQDGLNIALFSIPYNSINFHISEFNLQIEQIIDADYDFSLSDAQTLPPHTYSPKGSLIVVGYGHDDKLHLINLTNQKDAILQFPFPSHSEALLAEAIISTISIDSNENYIAGGSINGDIYIWNFANGTLLKSFKAHNIQITDGWRGGIKILEFSPSSNLLLSVGYADSTKLWNADTGVLLKEIKTCHDFGGFTQDGRYLAASGKNGIEVWGIP
jgi:WD40 repeat protein